MQIELMSTPEHPKTSHAWYSKKVAIGKAAEEGSPEGAVHGPTSEDEFYARVRQGDIATTDMAMSPTRTNGKWCRVDRIPGCAWARHEWVTAQKQDAVKARDAEAIRILKHIRLFTACTAAIAILLVVGLGLWLMWHTYNYRHAQDGMQSIQELFNQLK